jgi:hypothetical protein
MWGSASLRRADAAQVCNDAGDAGFVAVHDCPALATAARQIVSERW